MQFKHRMPRAHSHTHSTPLNPFPTECRWIEFHLTRRRRKIKRIFPRRKLLRVLSHRFGRADDAFYLQYLFVARLAMPKSWPRCRVHMSCKENAVTQHRRYSNFLFFFLLASSTEDEQNELLARTYARNARRFIIYSIGREREPARDTKICIFVWLNRKNVFSVATQCVRFGRQLDVNCWIIYATSRSSQSCHTSRMETRKMSFSTEVRNGENGEKRMKIDIFEIVWCVMSPCVNRANQTWIAWKEINSFVNCNCQWPTADCT